MRVAAATEDVGAYGWNRVRFVVRNWVRDWVRRQGCI